MDKDISWKHFRRRHQKGWREGKSVTPLARLPQLHRSRPSQRWDGAWPASGSTVSAEACSRPLRAPGLTPACPGPGRAFTPRLPRDAVGSRQLLPTNTLLHKVQIAFIINKHRRSPRAAIIYFHRFWHFFSKIKVLME